MPLQTRYITEILKGEIKRNARYRCEYCKRTPASGEIWEVEHITPRSAGGTDAPDNLAFACRRCNLNKREAVEAADPTTGLFFRLFNPRKDSWDDHFFYVHTNVVGKTPVGRATAKLLFKTTSQTFRGDLEWKFILPIESRELYFYLNEQRARRLANEFTILDKEFIDFPGYEIYRSSKSKDRFHAQIAMVFLKIESCLMHSRERDVEQGIALAKQLLSRRPAMWVRTELHNMLSILYQQLATIYALKGNHKKSRFFQRQSSRSYNFVLLASKNVKLQERLRQASLATKYDVNASLNYDGEDLRAAMEEAQYGNLRSVTYLADDELRLASRSRHFDRVARTIEEALETSGYGQDFDYARAVVLRRRWWAFKVLADESCDLDLLKNDIEFWKSIRMHNETRELSLLITRIRERHNIVCTNDMLAVIQSHAPETRR